MPWPGRAAEAQHASRSRADRGGAPPDRPAQQLRSDQCSPRRHCRWRRLRRMAGKSGWEATRGLRACPLIRANSSPGTIRPPGQLRLPIVPVPTSFDAAAVDGAVPVMLDTTVYLDALKPPGLPPAVATLVARNVVLHCSVRCAELAVSVAGPCRSPRTLGPQGTARR